MFTCILNFTFVLTLTVLQTYIGPVLVSVNPFKQLNIYTNREIEIYQGAVGFVIVSVVLEKLWVRVCARAWVVLEVLVHM